MFCLGIILAIILAVAALIAFLLGSPDTALIILLVAIIFLPGAFRGGGRSSKADEEEDKRKQTSCNFSDGISEKDFKWIVAKSGKNIKRLTDLTTAGPVVFGTVWAQSGISKWNFTIDFNDYGHLTGKYWISSNNSDSDIPSVLAKRIKDGIQNFDRFKAENSTTSAGQSTVFCSNCGSKITGKDVRFCPYCGKKVDG